AEKSPAQPKIYLQSVLWDRSRSGPTSPQIRLHGRKAHRKENGWYGIVEAFYRKNTAEIKSLTNGERRMRNELLGLIVDQYRELEEIHITLSSHQSSYNRKQAFKIQNCL